MTTSPVNSKDASSVVTRDADGHDDPLTYYDEQDHSFRLSQRDISSGDIADDNLYFDPASRSFQLSKLDKTKRSGPDRPETPGVADIFHDQFGFIRVVMRLTIARRVLDVFESNAQNIVRNVAAAIAARLHDRYPDNAPTWNADYGPAPDNPDQINFGLTLMAGHMPDRQDQVMMTIARFIEQNPGLRTAWHRSDHAPSEARAPNATPVLPPGPAPGAPPPRPARPGESSWFSDDSSDDDPPAPSPAPPGKLKQRAQDFCVAPIGNSWNLIKGRVDGDVTSGPGFGC